MSNFRSSLFGSTPVVVKNLVIINLLFYATMWLLRFQGVDLTRILGAFYFDSPFFEPYQLITHMFMHAYGIAHIFFNMFALFIFGNTLERVWGPKRFLIYYFVTGFGAFFLHTVVNALELHAAVGSYTLSETALQQWVAIDRTVASIYLGPTVGASGAVFGLLLAFGMLFPNTELMLLFFPVPIKAKYFVVGYGLIELFAGLSRFEGDNIAHFAHLGGMLFGFILIKIWARNRNTFY